MWRSPRCHHSATALPGVSVRADIVARMAESNPSGPRRRPGRSGPLRDRFRDSIRDALSDVDVDALQGRTRAGSAGGALSVQETVSAIEAEVERLRAERAELQGRAAAPGGNGSAVASRPWSPAKAMDPLPGEAPGGAPAAVAPRSPASGAAPRSPRATVSSSTPVRRRPPAQRPGGAGTAAAASTRVPASAAGQPAAPATPQTPRIPRLARLRRPAAPSDAPPVGDAELEAVVAPLLAEVASLRAEVEQLRGPLPDLTTPAARNRNLMLLAVGVLVGFALIVIALAVVLKA
jgi:uncharacterized small protein (DUF1192 family)